MYIPRYFKVDDLCTAHKLIETHNFAVLISTQDGHSQATHLPLLLDRGRGPKGTLLGHVSRANAQGQSLRDDTELLAIFQGPHSYISPAWYRNQVTVPTWNYAAAHVYGRAKLVTSTDALAALVKRLIAHHEAQIGSPWDSRQMDAVFDSDLRGIIGFEIEIDRIDCAFKFNQNLSTADQQGVIDALSASGHPNDQAVAQIMRANLATDTDKQS